MENQEPFASNFTDDLLQLASGELLLPVYTVPLHEFKFHDFCTRNGITSYLPVQKKWRIIHRVINGNTYNYSKEIRKPIFPSYVFAKLTPDQRSQIFLSGSVTRILRLTPGEMPRMIQEMQAIHVIEQAALTQELVFNADIREGDHFLIESGPWQGVEGVLLKRKKRFNWQIRLECVNSTVAATIDPSEYKLTKLPPKVRKKSK